MDRARRAMPIGNKACHARFVKAQQERHKKKLREMKASIDTKEPHTRQGGKRRNPKKEQMMEERDAQIAALSERFQEKKDGIRLLGHRAREAGISEVTSLDDAVKLLFPHTAYKSYPENWLMQQRELTTLL